MQSEIKKVKFKPGLPLEIEVIQISATLYRHKAAMSKPHRADFYHIIWVQKGTAEYFIDFEPVAIPENSFLFISKDRVKMLNAKSVHDGKILIFTDNFFARSDEDIQYLHSTILFNDMLGIPAMKVTDLPSLQTIFNQIETELAKENDRYQADIAHGLLRSLLFSAEREQKKQGITEVNKGVDFDYTVLFKDLLEAQFKTLKSVSGYARQINISEKRLTTSTIKTVGKSPKIIIDERVVLESKRLLIHTHLSIKEIGFALGFDDPSYFIKYFRKHTNKTPIEFRESYLGG